MSGSSGPSKIEVRIIATLLGACLLGAGWYLRQNAKALEHNSEVIDTLQNDVAYTTAWIEIQSGGNPYE